MNGEDEGMGCVAAFLNNSNISIGQVNESTISISKKENSSDPDFSAINY
jgi:hypothetical protein